MNERELVSFCKTDAISKAELSQLIDDKAQAMRKRGESPQQAYAEFVCNDPLGQQLFAAMKSAAGPDHHQARAIAHHFRKSEDGPQSATSPMDDDEEDDGIGGKNPYHVALEALARKHMGQPGNEHKTLEAAYAHLAQHNDTGRRLMVAAKEWDLRRSARAQARAA
jgi:hypothetical protein